MDNLKVVKSISIFQKPHRSLPHHPTAIPVVILRVRNRNQNQGTSQQRLKDFEVNTNQVKVYLCQHNHWYQNVMQDVHHLDAYVSRLEDMSVICLII